MTDSFTGIIDQLERQKAAIERALAALGEVDPSVATKPELAITPVAPARKHRKRSAAVRRRMALAQKARWAKVKSATEPLASPAPEPSKPKRRISAEGLKRIIAATKKRWRLKRAAAKAALVKKVAAKKVAVKRAVVKAPPPAKAAKKVAPVRKTAVKKAVVAKAAPAPTPAVVQTAG